MLGLYADGPRFHGGGGADFSVRRTMSGFATVIGNALSLDDMPSAFEGIMGVLGDITPEASATYAWGDFKASWMVETSDFSSTQVGTGLNNMLVDETDDTVWGVVAFYMTIPCPGTGTTTAAPTASDAEDVDDGTLKLAFIYRTNQCGEDDYGVNFMVSLDPSILACYTGFGPWSVVCMVISGSLCGSNIQAMKSSYANLCR